MISILVPRVESIETNSWHSKSYQRSIVLSINVIGRPYPNFMLVKTSKQTSRKNHIRSHKITFQGIGDDN